MRYHIQSDEAWDYREEYGGDDSNKRRKRKAYAVTYSAAVRQKYYNEAYKLDFSKNYDTLFRIGDIYEKLGDTRSALKYLNEALQQSPNSNLENKIKKIEARHAVNKEFYSNTRIHG